MGSGSGGNKGQGVLLGGRFNQISSWRVSPLPDLLKIRLEQFLKARISLGALPVTGAGSEPEGRIPLELHLDVWLCEAAKANLSKLHS